MPAEIEDKFVLDTRDGRLEASLRDLPSCVDIVQHYPGRGHARLNATPEGWRLGVAYAVDVHPDTGTPGALYLLSDVLDDTDVALIQGMREIKGTCRVRRLQDADGTRWIHTIKIDPPDGHVWEGVLEIEWPIAEAVFDALGKGARSSVRKRRVSFQSGDVHWDVDFLKDADGETYIGLAEAEKPAGTGTVEMLPLLQGHVLHAVRRGDKRFNNAALGDPVAVRALVAGLLPA